MQIVEVGTGMVKLLMTLVLINVVGVMPWKMDLVRVVEVEPRMEMFLVTLVLRNGVGLMP